MEEEKINLETRILNYGEYYEAQASHKSFNFDYHPQRLIFKNYALRTQDKSLYAKFLNTFFPDKEEEELLIYDKELLYLKRFDKDELARWLIDYNVRLMQSDINSTDKDAIFKVIAIPADDNADNYLTKDDLILNYILPLDVLEFPYPVWVNIKLP
jgi:hypothetical protein